MKALTLIAALLLAPTLTHAQATPAQDCRLHTEMAGIRYDLMSLGETKEAQLASHQKANFPLSEWHFDYITMLIEALYDPKYPNTSELERAKVVNKVYEHCLEQALNQQP